MTPHRFAVAAAFSLGLAWCGGSSRTLVTVEMEPLTEPEVAAAEPLDRTRPPQPGERRPYALPEVLDLTLANGLAVTLVDRPAFPTLSVRLSVRAGRDAGGDGVALPELTGTLLRDGTEARSATDIAQFIEGNGIGFWATVEDNRVVLAAAAASTRLREMLELLSDLAAHAVFPEDRVAARRDELIAELRAQRAQPQFHRSRTARRVAFGEHPYARLYPRPEEVAAVTPADLRAFYASHFGPSRARLVIVGALPDDTEVVLTETLGTWSTVVPDYQPPPPVQVVGCNEAHVVLREESAQTSIIWLGQGIAMDAPDHIPAEVTDTILGGLPSARLFMNLRERRSYTYGAYSDTAHLLGASYFFAFADVRNDVLSPALDEFLAEFSRFQQETIPEQEIQEAISYLAGVFPIQLETNASLAERISSLLDAGQDLDYLVDYRDRVAAVSVEDATAAGRAFIDPSHLTLVLVGPEDVAVPAAEAHASRVVVYDLDGEWVREQEGALPSSCAR